MTIKIADKSSFNFVGASHSAGLHGITFNFHITVKQGVSHFTMRKIQQTDRRVRRLLSKNIRLQNGAARFHFSELASGFPSGFSSCLRSNCTNKAKCAGLWHTGGLVPVLGQDQKPLTALGLRAWSAILQRHSANIPCRFPSSRRNWIWT